MVCLFSRSNKLKENSILAHRGFWGYLPEHSIKGFELAYFMGADYLETDINLTKDGELIIIHDAFLDDVTDVNIYPEFEIRRKNATVDGSKVTNKLFVSDFTLEEINVLYLKQRNRNRPQIYNKEFRVLKLETLIEMTISYNKKYNKTVGIYVEPKSIDYYNKEGMDLNQILLSLLNKYDLTNFDLKSFLKCPIVIQSFDFETLVYFRKSANLPQVALMRWSQFYNLYKWAEFSDGFGPDVDFLLYERVDNLLLANGTLYSSQEDFTNKVISNRFIESIQTLGNRILGSTENQFIKFTQKLDKHVQVWNLNNDAPKFSFDPALEFAKLTSLGVSAFFTDFCDTALLAVRHYTDLVRGINLNLNINARINKASQEKKFIYSE